MKRAPRKARREHTQLQRHAARWSAERQTPGWLIQHGYPARRVRRAMAQIEHDHSSKRLVPQIQRVVMCDAVVARQILEDMGEGSARVLGRSKAPPLASLARDVESQRAAGKFIERSFESKRQRRIRHAKVAKARARIAAATAGAAS